MQAARACLKKKKKNGPLDNCEQPAFSQLSSLSPLDSQKKKKVFLHLKKK
jgi:hypothetical protein